MKEEKWNDEGKIKEKDCYCECYSCGKRIDIGDDFRYTTSGYTTYCADFDCVDGVATEGSNLEHCWFGEENIIWEEE
tara:strand:+ start:336 stop:566 length:231 start_codon:yes stop_codon:yes gene_type:complete